MDNKTKFFKNVVLLQFIPVVLLGILILSNLREQKILKIRELHPYEFNYGHAVPLLFFGAAFVLSLLSFFSKQKEAPEDEAAILKIKRKQNFWKFAFYCNVFLLTVITIFSIALFRKNPFVIDQPSIFYSLVFSRSLLVLIISLVAASFLLAVGINWKTNRAFSVTILIFSFFIFSVSFVCEVLFISKFMDASESYIAAKKEKKASVNEEEQGEEEWVSYAEVEEIDQNKYPIVEKSDLISSVDSLITAWGGFENETDFYDRRILVKRTLASGNSVSEYIAMRYMDVRRDDPEAFYEAFNTYKSVLYNAVSLSDYHRAEMYKIVDGLLLAYNDIGGKTEKLDEIYAIMLETDGKYLSELETYYDPKTVQALKEYQINDGKAFFNGDYHWFYSFWARRNKEGNAKETVLILKEIKNHYD
jgi:hypothetical protein